MCTSTIHWFPVLYAIVFVCESLLWKSKCFCSRQLFYTLDIFHITLNKNVIFIRIALISMNWCHEWNLYWNCFFFKLSDGPMKKKENYEYHEHEYWACKVKIFPLEFDNDQNIIIAQHGIEKANVQNA